MDVVLHKLFIFSTGCKNGDIRNHNNQPQIFFMGEFRPICGNRFWDSDDGAHLFCKKLGFPEGKILKEFGQSNSSQISLDIGSCESTDGYKSLEDCLKAKWSPEHLKLLRFEDCTVNHTYKILCNNHEVWESVTKASCDVTGKR